MGNSVDPPVNPTLVRITPEAQPYCASGNQNQLSANVAVSVCTLGSIATVDNGTDTSCKTNNQNDDSYMGGHGMNYTSLQNLPLAFFALIM